MKQKHLFQAIFALIGLLFIAFGIFDYQRYAGYENWIEAPIEITGAELRITRDTDGTVDYDARVSHRYEIDGKVYIGSQFFSAKSKAEAQAIVADFNNGNRSYILRANPDDPSVTAGEDNPQIGALFFAGFGALFVLIAIGFFFVKTGEARWEKTYGDYDDDPLDRTATIHD